eukprot:764942-Hanusia_phi.AAC.2
MPTRPKLACHDCQQRRPHGTVPDLYLCQQLDPVVLRLQGQQQQQLYCIHGSTQTRTDRAARLEGDDRRYRRLDPHLDQSEPPGPPPQPLDQYSELVHEVPLSLCYFPRPSRRQLLEGVDVALASRHDAGAFGRLDGDAEGLPVFAEGDGSPRDRVVHSLEADVPQDAESDDKQAEQRASQVCVLVATTGNGARGSQRQPLQLNRQQRQLPCREGQGSRRVLLPISLALGVDRLHYQQTRCCHSHHGRCACCQHRQELVVGSTCSIAGIAHLGQVVGVEAEDLEVGPCQSVGHRLEPLCLIKLIAADPDEPAAPAPPPTAPPPAPAAADAMEDETAVPTLVVTVLAIAVVTTTATAAETTVPVVLMACMTCTSSLGATQATLPLTRSRE